MTGKRIPDAISRLSGVNYQPLCDARPGVSKEFSNIIDRCLYPQIEKRYQSIGDLIADYKHTMHLKSPSLHIDKRPAGKSVFAELLSGPFAGYMFKMGDSGIMNIGRNSKMCDAVIPASDISRIHCRVMYENGGSSLLVTDLSSHGTYRENGTRLPLNTAIRLGFGEKIYLANPNYELQFIII